MPAFLRGARVGQQYVYFDGVLIPVEANRITLKGIHSSHDLAVVPQVEAVRDSIIVRDLLSNPRYWDETALRKH